MKRICHQIFSDSPFPSDKHSYKKKQLHVFTLIKVPDTNLCLKKSKAKKHYVGLYCWAPIDSSG